MGGIIGQLLDYLGQLVSDHWPLLIAGAAALGLGCVGLYFLVQLWGRYRDTRGAFKLTPRYYYAQKKKLLKNQRIREAFAPFDRFTTDLEEGQKRKVRLPAWLHPYPAAVLAAGAAHKVGNRKEFDARAQISELAKWISVGTLPTWVPEEASRDTYWIELGKTGDHTDEQLEGFKGLIKNTLRVKSVEPYPDTNDNVVSFIVRVKEEEDPFVAIKAGKEFFEENPAKPDRNSPAPMGVPLAVERDLTPWALPIHHTLIFGATGSGKGSPIQGIIHQLAPFVAKGLVNFYGVDPKWAELGPYADSSLHTPIFKRITGGSTEDDLRAHATTIAQVMEVLSHRMKNKKVNLDASKGKVDLGRSFTASKSNPMVIFIIDEFFSLKTQLQTTLRQESKKPLGDLDTLLAMGRSYGVFVVLATQFATAESLGAIRDNIANKITLRHEATNYITTFMLGDDALELGYNPKKIGPSNPQNGNRTAGIGYVRAETGEVQKVRFAYLSDEDIADLAFNFRMEEDDEPEGPTTPSAQPGPQAAAKGRGLPRYNSIQQRQIGNSEW